MQNFLWTSYIPRVVVYGTANYSKDANVSTMFMIQTMYIMIAYVYWIKIGHGVP